MEVRPAANQPEPIKASTEPPSKTINQDPELSDKDAVAKAMRQAGLSQDEDEATIKQLNNKKEEMKKKKKKEAEKKKKKEKKGKKK